MIALLVLVASAALLGLGSAVASKYEQAARFEVAASGGGDTAPAATPLPVGTLANTVKDSAGQPLAGVTVSIQGPVYRELTTDSNGLASVADLPPGTYTVSAWTATHGTPAGVPLVVGDTEGVRLSLTMVRMLGTVRVLVRDEAGNAVPDVWVAHTGWLSQGSVQTDAAGVATFNDTYFAGQAFSANAPGVGSVGWTFKDFTEGDTDLTLTLR